MSGFLRAFIAMSDEAMGFMPMGARRKPTPEQATEARLQVRKLSWPNRRRELKGVCGGRQIFQVLRQGAAILASYGVFLLAAARWFWSQVEEAKREGHEVGISLATSAFKVAVPHPASLSVPDLLRDGSS